MIITFNRVNPTSTRVASEAIHVKDIVCIQLIDEQGNQQIGRVMFWNNPKLSDPSCMEFSLAFRQYDEVVIEWKRGLSEYYRLVGHITVI